MIMAHWREIPCRNADSPRICFAQLRHELNGDQLNQRCKDTTRHPDTRLGAGNDSARLVGEDKKAMWTRVAYLEISWRQN
jgi:hypothetical protein